MSYRIVEMVIRPQPDIEYDPPRANGRAWCVMKDDVTGFTLRDIPTSKHMATCLTLAAAEEAVAHYEAIDASVAARISADIAACFRLPILDPTNHPD
jgi:hypothetical protein